MKISLEREVSGTEHHEYIGMAFTYGYYFEEDRVFGVKFFWRWQSYWFAICINKPRKNYKWQDCVECYDQHETEGMYETEAGLICEACFFDSFNEGEEEDGQDS